MKIDSEEIKAVQPPPYNMGVARTEEQRKNPASNKVLKENNCLFDWMSFTLKKNVSVSYIITYLLKMNIDDFIAVDRGNYGYKNQMVNGNIRIYTDGNKDMGIHVQMTGQGCRQAEESLKGDWLTLINSIKLAEGEFSRCDIAVDDKEGLLDIDVIYKKTLKKEYVSRFTSWDQHTSCKNDSDIYGKSVYFGSATSAMRIRIYDKAVEQEVEDHWIRVELQLRDERANIALELYLQGKTIGAIVTGVLKNYLRFVEPDKDDSNKRRWKESKFWEKFINAAELLKLTSGQKKATLEDIYKWISKSVAPSLALLVRSSEGEMGIIQNLVIEGMFRLKSKHLAMIEKK